MEDAEALVAAGGVGDGLLNGYGGVIAIQRSLGGAACGANRFPLPRFATYLGLMASAGGNRSAYRSLT